MGVAQYANSLEQEQAKRKIMLQLATLFSF